MCEDPAGRHKDLAIIKRCELVVWVLKCIEKGRRKQGSQTERYEDNISDWTDLKFTNLGQGGSGEQGELKKASCKLSVVLQQPSRYTDGDGRGKD